MKVRNIGYDNKNKSDILIIDTGGGYTSTIVKRACLVLHATNHRTELIGYQSKNKPQTLSIVNVAVKATIRTLDNPIILLITYVTLLNDDNETESLLQPFSCMRHGIKMDLTPDKHGGTGGMTVDGPTVDGNAHHIVKQFEEEKNGNAAWAALLEW